MPETASAITAEGCAIAGVLTADHRSVCSLRDLRIDRPQLLRVSRRVEQHALVEIRLRAAAHFRRIRRRQQIGADECGADRVGFGLFEVLALVVTADRHRKAEADDEAEQRQRRGKDYAEIFARAFVDCSSRALNAGLRSALRPTSKRR